MTMGNDSGGETLLSAGSATKQPSETAWRGHPILRGGNSPHPHQFGTQEMKALAAVCDTFLPSVDVGEASAQCEGDLTKTSSDDVNAFYRLSASDVGLTAEVAGYMTQSLRPKILFVARWVLWMLTTSLGTLLLFGRTSFTWRYPFVQCFVDFTPERREKALLSWASSGSSIFVKLFKLFRGYSLFCFYAKVDENGQNPCWSAVGYCGPDPRAKLEECAPKPLEGKVLDPESSKEKLASHLVDGGFTLLNDVSHLRPTPLPADKNAGSRSPRREMGVKCDVVVVGSGSGGGVIAGTLAKAGYKVLVLEKGRYFARGDLTLLEGPSMRAMYEAAGALTTDDGSVSLLAGATVGGGSAINWAASFRTPDHVTREWADVHGLSSFATQEYQQAMDDVCARGSVRSICKEESFQNQVLTQGCKNLNYDIGQIPRNAQGEHSCGWCTFGCKTGEKQATSETWLVDAVEAGALILSRCSALQVLHREADISENPDSKGRKAVGVMASWGGEDLTLYVEAAITVVCCGSLNTPPLLLRSGLKNPNIGRHLRLHPVIMGWGYFPPGGGGPSGNVYEGPIMTAVSKETANWNSSGYGALLEVPILHPANAASAMPWRSGVDHKKRMRKYSRTSHFIVLTRDKGSGRVGLDSLDGQRESITYAVDPHDEGSLFEGVQHGLLAMVAAGAEEVGIQHASGETFSFKDRKSSSALKEEFQDFLKGLKKRGLEGLKTAVWSAHQMGSCRMGVNRQVSVVDPSGETWDAEGLFLGDASVFPTASGVNPMITVQSIALCTARKIILKLQNRQFGDG